MSGTQSAQSTKGESHDGNAFADALKECSHLVGVVEEEVGDETITKFYTSYDGEFAEILPERPRASRVKYHKVVRDIKALPASADVRVEFQDEMTPRSQREIGRKIGKLRETDPEAGSRATTDADRLRGGRSEGESMDFSKDIVEDDRPGEISAKRMREDERW